MILTARVLTVAICFLLTAELRAAAEIVVAIRYLKAEGASHSHLYLYREDGKFLRQLTTEDSGQDVDPAFAPDGEMIVFSREKEGKPVEFWSVRPLGGAPAQLEAAPDWYMQAKTSPYFTNREETNANESPDASSSAAPGTIGERKTYKAPDGSVELILREDPGDPDDQVNGERHGKHYVLRYLKTGIQADFGALPGFFGVYEILHERQNPDKRFLFEGLLRVAFFSLHLNSTDGDTTFALDLNGPRFVRLSPNWAAPVALPGESAFLTLAENRYVPIPGSTKTANCSYLEFWDAQLQKTRYAKPKEAAIFYGASMYRSEKSPPVITIRQNAG
ncbi:MAG TPA: hypothetical protein VFA58_07575 [Chthoniobacterales bacterium]|nr:hypothetical protein [Chthoniobacterales bacterium]